MRVGILGGTFDPIHLAHEALGHAACSAFDLDYVLVMPTGNSYLKTVHGKVTSARHREAMVRLSIADDPKFRFSDLELRRQGYTFTADTLLQLVREEPETRWFFIVGADSLHGMRDWYAPEVICRYAELIVAGRKDQVPEAELAEDIRYLTERYGAVIHRLVRTDQPVSSTQIRREIREGLLPHPQLEPAVSRYIAEHGLYGKPQSEEKIRASLEKRLKPGRFRHTLGVMETAEALARRYGVDPERARLAGLLHDCGKNEGTSLTHGPIGAVIAREEYGITDEEILSAICWHTTGKPAMTDLEKIIFVADYIEPGRDRAPRLSELRTMAYEDLDKTILCILEDTLSYLRNSGTVIDEKSLETYNYYHQKIKR